MDRAGCDTLLAVDPDSRVVFAAVAGYKPTPLVIHVPEVELPFAGW